MFYFHVPFSVDTDIIFPEITDHMVRDYFGYSAVLSWCSHFPSVWDMKVDETIRLG